jgi:hypothetical protein
MIAQARSACEMGTKYSLQWTDAQLHEALAKAYGPSAGKPLWESQNKVLGTSRQQICRSWKREYAAAKLSLQNAPKWQGWSRSAQTEFLLDVAKLSFLVTGGPSLISRFLEYMMSEAVSPKWPDDTLKGDSSVFLNFKNGLFTLGAKATHSPY